MKQEIEVQFCYMKLQSWQRTEKSAYLYGEEWADGIYGYKSTEVSVVGKNKKLAL